MDSIGDFVLVIVHSLAHIKVDDLTDDANPLFLRQFYKALKVVCQDMFFSRTHNKPSTASLIGTGSTNNRAALEEALRGVKSPDVKQNVIGELVDLKVDGPTRTDFSTQVMSERLQGFENFTGNARLRQYLASKGGYLASSNFLGDRLRELKGLKAEVPKRPAPIGRPALPLHAPKDVIDSQLVELQTEWDNMSDHLAQVLLQESQLKEATKKLAAEGYPQMDKLNSAREKLISVSLRKEDLMKRLADTEVKISKKEAELKHKK
ncbi:uncharacterized protein LOC135464837 [Liolophura sinensis]|uniref:uncharacterized protein LOC135464837 n=1 Tax=Liolophura sinensis TaxID=3198878 RepID=UPI0031584BBD